VTQGTPALPQRTSVKRRNSGLCCPKTCQRSLRLFEDFDQSCWQTSSKLDLPYCGKQSRFVSPMLPDRIPGFAYLLWSPIIDDLVYAI
jgi:hypothetical protein